MNRSEERRALEKARRCIAELDHVLDEAAQRAAEIGANDALERIKAAKAATRHGGDCVAKLRATLEPNDGEFQ